LTGKDNGKKNKFLLILPVNLGMLEAINNSIFSRIFY